MPRGKLYFEAFEEDGMVTEHWLDSHGNHHIETYEIVDDDTGESAANWDDDTYKMAFSDE